MNLDVEFDVEQLKVIEQFISAKVESSGINGVVFGVSGGLDSAVVFTISSRLFTPDQISPVFLPESTTPKQDAEDALVISKHLKIPLIVMSIDPLMHAFLDAVKLPKTNPTAKGNLKARLRMNILYFIANSQNRMVLGTSNKSELLLGYYTKFGDGASDVAPLGDLYKTQVRGMARYLKIPSSIIEKLPTAGLVPDQTDEGELGLSYTIIDKILFGLECEMAVQKIAKLLGLDQGTVEGVKVRVEQNRHKRKFPKIPKLGLKTIGADLYE